MAGEVLPYSGKSGQCAQALDSEANNTPLKTVFNFTTRRGAFRILLTVFSVREHIYCGVSAWTEETHLRLTVPYLEGIHEKKKPSNRFQRFWAAAIHPPLSD